MNCPICDHELIFRANGIFDCPSCKFIGDSKTILIALRLKQEGESLLRWLEDEKRLVIDGLQALQTQGNWQPLAKVIEAIHSESSQLKVHAMEMVQVSRRKYARTIALIELGAFADWFVNNLSLLSEGKLPVLQAAFPFMLLFSGAFLLYMTAK